LPDNKPLAATRVPDNVEARQARHVELDGIELRTGNIEEKSTTTPLRKNVCAPHLMINDQWAILLKLYYALQESALLSPIGLSAALDSLKWRGSR
jgi:hypothetical protein